MGHADGCSRDLRPRLYGANISNIGDYVVAGVIFVVTVLATALGFGVAMIAKVALALLVALGHIFIACALFDATRRYFFGWLSQAVNLPRPVRPDHHRL